MCFMAVFSRENYTISIFAMPYRRRYRRNRRKRYKTYKKRSRKSRMNKSSMVRVRQVSGMPDLLITKLKYRTKVAALSIPTDNKTFAINGLFDPDISGTGHQPLAFDQFMSFYGRYEVKASKISAQILLNSNSQDPQFVAIYPSLLNAPFSTVSDTIMEQPYVKWKYVNQTANVDRAYIKNYISVKKLNGRSTASESFIGNLATNPANTFYWQILLHNEDGNNLTADINVVITYYCRFFHRINLAGS